MYDNSFDWNIAFNSAEKKVTTINILHNRYFLECKVSFFNRKEHNKKATEIANIPIQLPRKWVKLKSKLNP